MAAMGTAAAAAAAAAARLAATTTAAAAAGGGAGTFRAARIAAAAALAPTAQPPRCAGATSSSRRRHKERRRRRATERRFQRGALGCRTVDGSVIGSGIRSFSSFSFSSSSSVDDDEDGREPGIATSVVLAPPTAYKDGSNDTATRIVDVSDLADSMRQRVRSYTSSLRRQQRQEDGAVDSDVPRLAGIMVVHRNGAEISTSSSELTAAETYSQQIADTFRQDGIEYELHRVVVASDDEDEDDGNWYQKSLLREVERVIAGMNERNDVHGILVFYPVFSTAGEGDESGSTATTTATKHQHAHPQKGPYLDESSGVYYKTNDDYIRDLVRPSKDVEGLHRRGTDDLERRYDSKLFRARGRAASGSGTGGDGTANRNNDDGSIDGGVYVPCTAMAVLEVLEAYHFPTVPSREGRVTATIVNRSEIFGRPLAALLALEYGATVYSVDDRSILQFDGEAIAGKIGTNHGDKVGGVSRISKRCNDVTLEECLERSSIVVTGVPSPYFVLPSEYIAEGTTIVNVSEFESNVDVDSLLEQQRPNIRIVPHIGKVTCAALEQNLIRLHAEARRKRAVRSR